MNRRPLIYLISDRRAFRRKPDAGTEAALQSAQLAAIAEAARTGCQLIQIREKDLSARELCTFTRAAVAAARPHGARVLVNDRLDVALASGADGVHLRVNSLPATEVRRIATQQGRLDFLIGVSTHSLAEAQAAEAAGASCVVCGPVFATPSKQAYGPPLGLKRFAAVCQAVKLPVLALGGITLSNFHEPLQCGAAGVAAIGLFTDREQLAQNVQTILNQSALPVEV